jgi:hypothetical protein
MNEAQRKQFSVRATQTPKPGTTSGGVGLPEATDIQVGDWFHAERICTTRDNSERFHVSLGELTFNVDIDRKGRVTVQGSGQTHRINPEIGR